MTTTMSGISVYPGITALLADIDSLDFGNAEEVSDFAVFLINYAGSLGWGSGQTVPAATRSRILTTARQWLRQVETRITDMSAADALTVLEPYDFLHRIIHKALPDPRFMFAHVVNALDARVSGDKSVDPYKLYKLIGRGLRSDFGLYKDKPLSWKSVMLDSWHEEFRSGTYRDVVSTSRASRISDFDVVSRVAALLGDDLWVFESRQKNYKQRLFDNHRHYIDDVYAAYRSGERERSTVYDIRTLASMRDLVIASGDFLTEPRQNDYTDAILTAISARTVSPYLRASIACLRPTTSPLFD